MLASLPCILLQYGGILIIFDIAFGTFVLEDETPVYGLVTPIQSFDPFYVQLHKFKENWDSCIEQPSVSFSPFDSPPLLVAVIFHLLDCDAPILCAGVEKAVKVWVKGPAWNPAGGLYDAPEVDPQKVQKYDPKVPGRQQAFAIFTFVTALVFGLPVLVSHAGSPHLFCWCHECVKQPRIFLLRDM